MSQRLMMPPPPPRMPRVAVDSNFNSGAENPEAEADIGTEPLQPDSCIHQAEEHGGNCNDYDETGLSVHCDGTVEVKIIQSLPDFIQTHQRITCEHLEMCILVSGSIAGVLQF